jgi:hypothetical protein
MTVFDIILERLGQSQVTEAMVLAVAEAEQLIKNYCGITEVPGPLTFVWAELALASLADNEAAGGSLPATGAVLSAVSLGDTSYSFAAAKDGAAASLRQDVKSQLNRWRKGLFAHE